jgi:hypothetical protein
LSDRPGEGLDADGEPVTRAVDARLSAAVHQQPRDVGAVPALGDLLRLQAVLPHEVVRGVGRRGVDRRAEAPDQAPRVALVPGRGEHHDRLAVGREGKNLLGYGERVEEHQPLAVVERVRRDLLRPPLLRRPLRMRRLPVPETCPQLAHRATLPRGAGRD